MLKKLFFFLFFLIFEVHADSCMHDCVDSNSWAIGMGLGKGEYSNPLHDGKDTSFSIVPSFYYYSENFYIENTELGYVVSEDQNWSVKLTGRLNLDGLYFNDSLLNDIAIPVFPGPGNFDDDPDTVSANDVDRDLSYLAGLTTSYYATESLMLYAGFHYDISNVHRGYKLESGFNYSKRFNRFYYSMGAKVQYADDKLNQYYYGLTADDNTQFEAFKVGADSSLSADISLSYRFNSTYAFVTRYSYQWLSSEVTNSPLVEDDYTSFFFIGFTAKIGSD